MPVTAATPVDATTTPATASGTLRDRAVVTWTIERSAALAVVLATAALFLTPVYYTFKLAFEDDARGLRVMWNKSGFGELVWTTAQLALGAAVVAVPLGTLLAWWAYRLPPRRRWLGLIPLAPLVVPQISLVTGYIFLMSPRVGYLNSVLRTVFPFLGSDGTGPFNVYSVRWMIIITGLSLSALVFLFIQSALAHIHQELLDAAHASGAGPLSAFARVVLPLLRPALVYSTLTVVTVALGQFTVPLLLGAQQHITVLTTQIYTTTQNSPADYQLAAAYGLPILAVGLVCLVVMRVLLRDQRRFVTAGGKGTRPLGGSGPLAQTLLVLYGVATVLLPIVALAIVALQPYWSGQLRRVTWANVDHVLSQDTLTDSVVHSLQYAAWTVAIAIPVAYVCARIITRSQSRVLAAIQELIVSLPLGIPAVLFGIGFLFTFTQSFLHLYGKPWALVLVYVTIVMPFAVRMQLAAMANLGNDLDDAAAVSGAGLVRRVLVVDLPLLRASLAAGAALVVVLASQEFAASILVRTTNTQVMGTALYDLYAFGSYPQAAVMALVMCLVTAAGVGVALILGGRGFRSARSLGG